MEAKKFNLEELKNVTGGTLDEGFAYMDSLIIKYGLTPGDYAALDPLYTEEELDYLTELIMKK